MKPYRLFLFAAALLLGFSASAQNESLASIITNSDLRPVPAIRTSIIYFQCRGLGYGDLSCYGQTNYQTPNLDRLAGEGMRFTNFRPAGTNFSTSLAALVSGKKSGDMSGPTIATRLMLAGYRTALIGEWTLGDRPWSQGFQEFVGFIGNEGGRNYYPDRLRRFAPNGWMTESNTLVDYDGYTEIYENTGDKKGIHQLDLLGKTVGNYLRTHKPDEFNKFKPFFLMVNLPVPRSAQAGADEFPVPSDAPFTDEKWPQAAKDRAALITRLDGLVGQILEQFKTLGISNNVALFFGSSEAPEKFASTKLNFINPNGSAQAAANAPAPLPMIVWWPEVVRGKQTSAFSWNGTDFATTALEIAVAPRDKNLDGINFLPVLEGKGGREVDAPTPGKVRNF